MQPQSRNKPSLSGTQNRRIEQRNISITAKMLGSERDSQTQRRMRDELPKNPDIQRPNTHSKHLGNIMRKCKMENILLDIKQATHTVNPIPPWENDLANYNYTQLDKPKEQCTLQELKNSSRIIHISVRKPQLLCFLHRWLCRSHHQHSWRGCLLRHIHSKLAYFRHIFNTTNRTCSNSQNTTIFHKPRTHQCHYTHRFQICLIDTTKNQTKRKHTPYIRH